MVTYVVDEIPSHNLLRFLLKNLLWYLSQKILTKFLRHDAFETQNIPKEQSSQKKSMILLRRYVIHLKKY